MTAKRTAVITGASSGIGAIYADRLAARGYDILIAARNAAALERQAQLIRDRHHVDVRVLVADLAQPQGLQKLEDVLQSDQSIALLVNNAGLGSASGFLQADLARMEEMIAINVTAVVRLAFAAAGAFTQRKSGTIINISSIAAVGPEILNGVYGGSKSFVLAFSQALHHELAEKGVRVQVVLPGATATGFWDVAGLPVAHLPQASVMSPEQLVDAALVGLDKGEFATLPSLQDEGEWKAFEAARQAMLPHLSSASVAARYRA